VLEYKYVYGDVCYEADPRLEQLLLSAYNLLFDNMTTKDRNRVSKAYVEHFRNHFKRHILKEMRVRFY
jgi:hypothetical protein